MSGVPRLELVGQVIVGGAFLEADTANHLASALIGRHRLEELRLADQRAYSGRSVDLVAGEGIEVAVQVKHVHREVRGGLGTVHQHPCSRCVRGRAHLLDGVDGAERVGQVDDRYEAGALTEQAEVRLEIELSFVADGNHPQARSALLAQHLPRHDVGVMLHVRDEDFIAFVQTGAGGSSAPRD